MEDGLDLQKSKKVEHLFLTQEFNRYCPFYISLGMTYEQFWEGDPTITRAYLEAYRIKQKREAQKTKWEMWELGLYVREAIYDISPTLQAFSKSKKPLQSYPKKPWGIDEISDTENEKDKQLEEKQKELDMYRAQIFFTNWANATKKHFQDKKQ